MELPSPTLGAGDIKMVLIRSPTPARNVLGSCGKCPTFILTIGSLPCAKLFNVHNHAKKRYYYPHASEEKTKEQRFCDLPEATLWEGLEGGFECCWFGPEPERQPWPSVLHPAVY